MMDLCVSQPVKFLRGSVFLFARVSYSIHGVTFFLIFSAHLFVVKFAVEFFDYFSVSFFTFIFVNEVSM